MAGPRLSPKAKTAAAKEAPAKRKAAPKSKAPKSKAPKAPARRASNAKASPPTDAPSGKRKLGKAGEARAPRPTPPTSDSLLAEAERDGLALVQVATVARPLGGGSVDVAALGAGAFLSIGPRSEVPLLVATAIAAWAERAAPAGILVVLDQGLEESEAAFSALASKLGREVRVRQWAELELDTPNLARLATVDRAARRAFLTSVHLPLAQTASIRIDPLALDDAASHRPVRLEREAHGFRVRPGARGRV